MKNGKINMLQLVNGFAIGGGEMKVLELVQNLDKDRYNITVCSVGQGGPLEAEFRKSVERVEIYDKKLQDKLITRKIQLEQLERKTYFENLYFDTHEREEETWEDQLRLYQGNPQ